MTIDSDTFHYHLRTLRAALFSRDSCSYRGPCRGSTADLCQTCDCRRGQSRLPHFPCRKSIPAPGALPALPRASGWWWCYRSSFSQLLASPALPAQPGSGQGWWYPCKLRRSSGRDLLPARHSYRPCWSWPSAAVLHQRPTPGRRCTGGFLKWL